MTRRTTLALGVTLVAALAGCSISAGPEDPDSPAIRTDAQEYALESDDRGWRAEIPYTFVNRTGEDVYLENCRGGFALRLDRWQEDEGEWEEAWSPALLMCLSPPIVIGAGETFRDTIGLFAGRPDGNAAPRFEVDEVGGTYRIVWIAGTHGYEHGESRGEQIPFEYRVSNSFVLRE